MAEDLAARQAELLEASRLASIGQVASGVAHEINNPLGVMLGYLRLLRREAALADREELRIIEDEARQCQAIVAGLLDLARPVRLQVGTVELGEVVSEAVSRLDDSGQCDGVDVTVKGGPAAHITADESKLRQITVNLLGNAIEAARDPAAVAPTVEVSWTTDGDGVSLRIDDRGPGIPQELRARVFEPFVTTRARGHGLGLAIARSLARAHGGDIELEPRPGGGTSARLIVPVGAQEVAS
jgi:signal transduction histidine kinase